MFAGRLRNSDSASYKSQATPGLRAHFEIRHVSKRYGTASGGVEALRDINLSVAEGEFVSVVGPSGCGKSTLLRIIAGLDQATAGEVLLRGDPVVRPSTKTAMVFQQPTLLDWRDALRNVLLPAEVSLGRQGRNTTSQQRARDLLTLVGLGGFEGTYPYELSGGMQQRVSLARALMSDPELLLMDEPFGALDAITREQMNLELLRIWRSDASKTTFFITHSVQEAVILSDRVVILSGRPGRVTGVVDIELERPRRFDMLESPAGLEARQRIRTQLDSDSTGKE